MNLTRFLSVEQEVIQETCVFSYTRLWSTNSSLHFQKINSHLNWKQTGELEPSIPTVIMDLY